MENKRLLSIETVIDYVEQHLDGKVDLEKTAEAVHYSKYHLHRMFTETVGMTLHDYVQRRQLTEAAKILAFSRKPIIEVAFICGYESQQAFSTVFKEMYKMSPAAYREQGVFYPLQLRFSLYPKGQPRAFEMQDICLAEPADLPAWMELMRLVIDGYPMMDEEMYKAAIARHISENRALVLKDGPVLIGAMAFDDHTGSIEFLGVHPQYRRRGIQKLFIEALIKNYLPGRQISMTTFREGDRADTGYRENLKQLGFAERELLVEFGYPTQRFVLPANEEEDARE